MINDNNKKRKAMNLIEYLLIFAMVAIGAVAFVTKFNFSNFKNYVFNRPTDSTDSSKIKFEAMTE